MRLLLKACKITSEKMSCNTFFFLNNLKNILSFVFVKYLKENLCSGHIFGFCVGDSKTLHKYKILFDGHIDLKIHSKQKMNRANINSLKTNRNEIQFKHYLISYFNKAIYTQRKMIKVPRVFTCFVQFGQNVESVNFCQGLNNTFTKLDLKISHFDCRKDI